MILNNIPKTEWNIEWKLNQTQEGKEAKKKQKQEENSI